MSLAALWLRAVLALGAVLLALAGLQFVVRFLSRGMGRFRARGRLLDVVETAALGQQSLLHVVRIADRYFALCVAQNHVAVVCEVPAPPRRPTVIPSEAR